MLAKTHCEHIILMLCRSHSKEASNHHVSAGQLVDTAPETEDDLKKKLKRLAEDEARLLAEIK